MQPRLVAILTLTTLSLGTIMAATPAQAFVSPAVGTWRTPLLDPWSIATPPSTDGFDLEHASDGDLGMLECHTFRRSAQGSDTVLASVDIDPAATSCAYDDLESYGNTWVAVFRNSGTTVGVYMSTDDGATWTLKQTITKTLGDLSLLPINPAAGRWGLAMAGTADTVEVRWWRTSDNFATWEATRTDVAIADCNLSVGIACTQVVGLVWSSSNIELFFAMTGGSAGALEVRRVTSNDGGGFWSAVSTTCSIGVSGTSRLSTTQWLNAATDGTVGVLTCAYSSTGPNLQTCRFTSFGAGCSLLTQSIAPGGTSPCPNTQRNSHGRHSLFVVSGTAYMYACWGIEASPPPFRLWQLPSASSTWSAVSSTGLPTSNTNNAAVTTLSPFDNTLSFAVSNGAASGRVDLHATRFAVPVLPTRGPIFCSANGNIDFGYEYREGVTGSTGGASYKFEGDDSNFDYLAKSWAPGTRIVAAYQAIQANLEGQDSVFRVAFSTFGTTPSATTKGNGLDTQHFSDHVEVRWLETGNDWNVRVFHVSSGNGVTSRTALGTAWVGGAPNNMEFYNVTVDTVALRVYVTRTVIFGDSAGAQTAVFPGGIQLPAYWSGDTFKSMWYVGYASETAFNNNADTFVDSGASGGSGFTPLSTCIYNLDAATTQTVNGDEGRTLPDTDGDGLDDVLDPDDDNDNIPDGQDSTPNGSGDLDPSSTSTESCSQGSILCVNSSTVPTGFTVGGFNALLGVLLMAGVGGGFYFIDTKSRYSMLFASIGALVGFFLAYFLGLFPLWLILVGVLILAAVLVMRFRGIGA